jgi:hypothetical protein
MEYAIKFTEGKSRIKHDMFLCGFPFPYWTNGNYSKFKTKLQAEQKAMKIGLHLSQYKIVKINLKGGSNEKTET